MTARFTVYGSFERVRPCKASVEIDRKTNLVTVRPHRRRRVYVARLDDLAIDIVYRTLKKEAAEKAKLKRQKRKT